jgi:hypothetical protein
MKANDRRPPTDFVSSLERESLKLSRFHFLLFSPLCLQFTKGIFTLNLVLAVLSNKKSHAH